MFGNRACGEIESLLWNYAARRVSEEDIERVESHLKGCPKCREQAAGYRQTLSALAVYEAQPTPSSQTNWQDLRARLTATPATPAPVGFRWKIPALTMGSLAAAALLLIVMNPFRATVSPGLSPGSLPDSISGTKEKTETVSTAPPPGKIVWEKATGDDYPLPEASSSETATSRGISGSGMTTVASREPRIRPHHRFYGAPRIQPPAPASHQDMQLVSASDVDGGRGLGRTTPENFVLSPVGYSTGQEDGPNYVMGSVAASRGNGASNIEEARGW